MMMVMIIMIIMMIIVMVMIAMMIIMMMVMMILIMLACYDHNLLMIKSNLLLSHTSLPLFYALLFLLVPSRS